MLLPHPACRPRASPRVWALGLTLVVLTASACERHDPDPLGRPLAARPQAPGASAPRTDRDEAAELMARVPDVGDGPAATRHMHETLLVRAVTGAGDSESLREPLADVADRLVTRVRSLTRDGCRRAPHRGDPWPGSRTPFLAALLDADAARSLDPGLPGAPVPAADLSTCPLLSRAPNARLDPARLDDLLTPRADGAHAPGPVYRRHRALADPSLAAPELDRFHAACGALLPIVRAAARRTEGCSPLALSQPRRADDPALPTRLRRLGAFLGVEVMRTARAGKVSEAARLGLDGLAVFQDLARGGVPLGLASALGDASVRVAQAVHAVLPGAAELEWPDRELARLRPALAQLVTAAPLPTGALRAASLYDATGAPLETLRASLREGTPDLDALTVPAAEVFGALALEQAYARACPPGSPPPSCLRDLTDWASRLHDTAQRVAIVDLLGLRGRPSDDVLAAAAVAIGSEGELARHRALVPTLGLFALAARSLELHATLMASGGPCGDAAALGGPRAEALVDPYFGGHLGLRRQGAYLAVHPSQEVSVRPDDPSALAGPRGRALWWFRCE